MRQGHWIAWLQPGCATAAIRHGMGTALSQASTVMNSEAAKPMHSSFCRRFTAKFGRRSGANREFWAQPMTRGPGQVRRVHPKNLQSEVCHCSLAESEDPNVPTLDTLLINMASAESTAFPAPVEVRQHSAPGSEDPHDVGSSAAAIQATALAADRKSTRLNSSHT